MSPGRPSTRREIERLFWGENAKGLTGEGAAVAVIDEAGTLLDPASPQRRLQCGSSVTVQPAR
ncbi:hypothetical protein [Streptomyces sp. NPDC091217]|uniref:hypothetical protein n=1 Tax=Streptomyces sp. NPDC091217 TaxID=3365975 RepID=UPI0038305015